MSFTQDIEFLVDSIKSKTFQEVIKNDWPTIVSVLQSQHVPSSTYSRILKRKRVLIFDCPSMVYFPPSSNLSTFSVLSEEVESLLITLCESRFKISLSGKSILHATLGVSAAVFVLGESTYVISFDGQPDYLFKLEEVFDIFDEEGCQLMKWVMKNDPQKSSSTQMFLRVHILQSNQQLDIEILDRNYVSLQSVLSIDKSCKFSFDPIRKYMYMAIFQHSTPEPPVLFRLKRVPITGDGRPIPFSENDKLEVEYISTLRDMCQPNGQFHFSHHPSLPFLFLCSISDENGSLEVYVLNLISMSWIFLNTIEGLRILVNNPIQVHCYDEQLCIHYTSSSERCRLCCLWLDFDFLRSLL